MPKGQTLQVVFKQVFQGQGMLIPLNLEELVPAGHPVRIVSAMLVSIDLKPVLRRYKAGDAGSDHPRMLLKALVFAYMNHIYSSRKIEEAHRRNIIFI